jgi:hypothetical protein
VTTGSGYLLTNSVLESIKIGGAIDGDGKIDFSIIDGSSLFCTGNATRNFYLNLIGSSSCALSGLIPLNNTLSITFMNSNGVTAYSLTGISIDGVRQTQIRWVDGTGSPPNGNPSSIDMYSIIAIRTGLTATSYSIFSNLTKFS